MTSKYLGQLIKGPVKRTSGYSLLRGDSGGLSHRYIRKVINSLFLVIVWVFGDRNLYKDHKTERVKPFRKEAAKDKLDK